MGKKKVISLLTFFALSFQVLPVSAVFTDVDATMQKNLDTLVSLHIISENSSQTFRPDASLNRAEAATMILRSSQVFDEKKPQTNDLTFSDIQSDAWYIPFVKGAVKFGIIKGYKDGTVKLENGVSKVELLTMLQRMDRNLLGAKNDMVGEKVAFMDVLSTDWFYDAVRWSQSFMQVTSKSFEPHQLLTRKDAANMLYAYVTKRGVNAKNSFGALTLADSQTATSSSKPNSSQPANQMAQPTATAGGASGSTAEMDKMMMPPFAAQPELTFTFSGAVLQDIPASVAISKVVPTELSSDVPSFVNSLPAQFQSFVQNNANTLKLQNVTFTDGERNGYQYFLDLVGGSYSMYEDWSRKIQPLNPTYELSSMPNISALVALARDFLVSRGVTLEGYGAGEVDMSWRMYSPMSTENMTYPVYYSVNFPLLVDNKKVISEWGYSEGAISVGIDETVHKVTSLYGAFPKEKVSSMYDAKTWDEILADALKGGIHMPYAPYYYAAETPGSSSGTEMVSPQTMPVTLTKAEEVMLLVHQYNDMSYMNSNDYYVPAVLFTGVYSGKMDQTYPAQEVKVVVPMVKSEFFPMPTPPIMYMKAEAAIAK